MMQFCTTDALDGRVVELILNNESQQYVLRIATTETLRTACYLHAAQMHSPTRPDIYGVHRSMPTAPAGHDVQ